MRVIPVYEYTHIKLNSNNADLTGYFEGWRYTNTYFHVRNGANGFSNAGDISVSFNASAEM